MEKLLIYMPALNEAETIASVIKSLPKQIDDFENIEVLVVNDGSTDNTKLEAEIAGAKVITHTINKGVGEAFHSALNYALKTKADILVSIDADGQFDVNEIHKMIGPIVREDIDFCIGNRFNNGKPKNMSKIKFWGNKRVNNIIGFICGQKINDASCGFRAYSKESLLHLNLQGSFTYTHETILDLLNKGLAVKQIPITVKYFEDRISRVANSIFKYAFKTLKIILKCFKDYMPFYFFMTLAIFVFCIAVFLGAFVLFYWYNTGYITPYKGVGIFSLALSGMALLISILALVADMLGRIRQNQEKLLYFLKKENYD